MIIYRFLKFLYAAVCVCVSHSYAYFEATKYFKSSSFKTLTQAKRTFYQKKNSLSIKYYIGSEESTTSYMVEYCTLWMGNLLYWEY